MKDRKKSKTGARFATKVKNISKEVFFELRKLFIGKIFVKDFVKVSSLFLLLFFGISFIFFAAHSLFAQTTIGDRVFCFIESATIYSIPFIAVFSSLSTTVDAIVFSGMYISIFWVALSIFVLKKGFREVSKQSNIHNFLFNAAAFVVVIEFLWLFVMIFQIIKLRKFY